MIITGTIDKIGKKTYSNNGKKVTYYELLISYNFYSSVNQILLLAKDFDTHLHKDQNQLYRFDFKTITKSKGDKIYTDFYLQTYKKIASSVNTPSLIVVRTYYKHDGFEVLRKQTIKGRVKVFAKFLPLNQNEQPLFCYFWEDNRFLMDLNEREKIQINCRSLPYKDKFISNIEVWRTLTNDNFLGSIL